MHHSETHSQYLPNYHPEAHPINVGKPERWASMLGGAVIMVDGLRRANIQGGLEAVVGTLLILRGATGHCKMYQSLNVNTAHANGSADALDTAQTVEVKKIVTIQRTPDELYEFWRKLDNLPRFMQHLESVEILDNQRSHWKAKAPAGAHVEWDAEITEDIPGELLAWRSLEGSDIANAGTVRFRLAPGGRGTEVEAYLKYAPPAGIVGSKLAKLFGEEPERQIREDLRRFKQLMEVGEIAVADSTVTGKH